MGWQLLTQTGESRGKAFPIDTFPFEIGRANECHLRPLSAAVSRHHCRILDLHGRLLLEDLGSHNGTFVNGQQLTKMALLNPDDAISLGPVVFTLQETAGEPVSPLPNDFLHTGSDEYRVSHA